MQTKRPLKTSDKENGRYRRSNAYICSLLQVTEFLTDDHSDFVAV